MPASSRRWRLGSPGTGSWGRASGWKLGMLRRPSHGTGPSMTWSACCATSPERFERKSTAPDGSPPMSRLESGLERLRLWDHALCIRFNCAVRIASVRWGFRLVSRLGDGIFWYALMLVMLVAGGAEAFIPVVRMAMTGAV